MTRRFDIGDQPRVLLVEDLKPLRDALAVDLADEGYHVEEAPDGEVAFGMLRERAADFAVVLTDVSMPGMTGIELLVAMGALPERPPVVVMSGYSELAADRAGALGAVRLLNKPFHPDALNVALQRAACPLRQRTATLDPARPVQAIDLEPTPLAVGDDGQSSLRLGRGGLFVARQATLRNASFAAKYHVGDTARVTAVTPQGSFEIVGEILWDRQADSSAHVAGLGIELVEVVVGADSLWPLAEAYAGPEYIPAGRRGA